jgi:hypothetical protein
MLSERSPGEFDALVLSEDGMEQAGRKKENGSREKEPVLAEGCGDLNQTKADRTVIMA